MSFRPRLSSVVWLFALAASLGFLGWSHARRVQRVDEVAALPDFSGDPAEANADSATGYAGGLRRLIAPEHHNETYGWIRQTQRAFATGEWRARTIDWENAPYGRANADALPYRAWLAGVAWLDHAATGRPLALATERAARFADPLLHVLLLVGAAVFAARHFGGIAAALLALGLATAFPFAGNFLAGVADDYGLSLGCALWSGLFLLAGILSRPTTPMPRTPRWFVLAGLAGGLGLWVNPSMQAPLLGGIALGGFAAAALRRSAGSPGVAPLPWRSWALASAGMSFAGWLVENAPERLGLALDGNGPLLALALLGAGEWLARLDRRAVEPGAAWTRRDGISLGAATLAVAALPVALWWSGATAGSGADPAGERLSLILELSAPSFGAWLVQRGFSTPAVVTLLPLLVLAPAAWALRVTSAPAKRAALAVAVSSTVPLVALAWGHLRDWALVDVAVLFVVVALAADEAARRTVRAGWPVLLAALLLPGALILRPRTTPPARESLSEAELIGTVERDLAHWLARRSAGDGPRAIVLAPPDLSAALGFHGDLRGLGSLSPQNRDGVLAAVRIVSATTEDEALALLRKRGVRFVALPTWDPFLEDYLRIGRRSATNAGAADHAFLADLQRWTLPPWLAPVAYPLPPIAGFESQSLALFEVVEEQDAATAAARLAEYFVETGRLELAAREIARLRTFPGHPAALAAQALVEAATGERAAFAQTLNGLVSGMKRGTDRGLPLDRRVCLAVVLAQGRQADLARTQLQRCLEECDDAQCRSLSPLALFRLLQLSGTLGVEPPDPAWRALAVRQLPPGLRGKLAGR